eukprot:Rmarinus@m.29369
MASARCVQMWNNCRLLYRNNGASSTCLGLRQLCSSNLSLPPSKHQEARQLLSNFRASYSNGQYETALQEIDRAASLIKEHLGEMHPAYASALNNQAIALKAMHKFEDAATNLTESVRVYRSILGDTHPSTTTTMYNLATLYKTAGGDDNLQSGKGLIEQAMYFREKKLEDTGASSNDDKSHALMQLCLAGIERQLGNATRSLELCREAGVVLEKVEGPESLSVANAFATLGLTLKDQKSFDQAEVALQQSLQIRKALLGDHPLTLDAAHNLLSLYQAWGLTPEEISKRFDQ